MSTKKSLKIAMLGHKRIPSREGGVEIVVEQLSTRMAVLGHEVTCYNRAGHHVSGKQYKTSELKAYKGVRLKKVLTIDKKGLAAMSASVSASIMAALGRYDVVHYHAEGSCFMMWLPKLFGKRCIATIHGLDHQREKWGKFASAYILAGEKMAVRKAEQVIVLSKGVQQYFMDNYHRETILIPNGVVRPNFRECELITQKWGLQGNDYILYLGRIVPEKGIQYLIKAYAQIHTDKKLVIAGGSSDTQTFMEELKQIAGTNPNIIFTGFVQGQLLEELYSNAYFYTLPSDLEGMPLSLLEAMSYGNCCLISDIPECLDVVEEHAVVFEKSNIEDLSKKMQMLCDSQEEVTQYKEFAADYVCDKYNWDNIVEQTLKVYDGG